MAIVPTSDTDVSAYASGRTHLILDMYRVFRGYFAP
jgi:hypothetical protein